MKNRHYIIASLLIILLVVIRLGYFAYQSKPIDSYELKSSAVTELTEYGVGDTLKWTVTLCKLHDSSFYSERTLVNIETGKDYPIPEISTKATLSKGQCGVIQPSVVIPVNANRPPGIYHLCSKTIVNNENRNIKEFGYCTNEFRIK